MEVNIEELLNLIDTLYNGQHQDPTNREKVQQASAWLGQLQKTVSTLVCWENMHI